MKLKLLMLIACGLFMSYSNSSNAQLYLTTPASESSTLLSDTMIIRLKDNNTLMLTGKLLADYKMWGEAADRIKTAFIVDWNKAVESKQIDKLAQTVFYFIDGENKRRLKTEAPEYTDNKVDVAYEIKRMRLNLPKYHYTIIDINFGVQIQVFMNNPDSLFNQLSEVSIQAAIQKAFENKKITKQYYRVEMATDSNQYRITNPRQVKYSSLEVNSFYGMTLFGNTFSPQIGLNLDISLSNKYGISVFKTGLDMSGFALLQSNNSELTNINLLTSYNAKALFNMNRRERGKAYWIGFSAGIIKSNSLSSYNNAFKFGLITEGVGPLTITFEFIQPRGFEDGFSAVGVRIPF